ncbi:MAG: M1 family metallopeptidase [Chitinophagaceae bacterium]
MHRYIYLFSIAVFCSQLSQAQDLFMPRDIKETYEKGTRSMNGKPGKNYWQNHGRYNITITVMPPGRIIKGTETITYFNNSPDTIITPGIKLFLNIHKAGAPRNTAAAADYLSSGMQVDKLLVDGKPARFRNDPMVFTNMAFRLPKPLLPHDSVQLSFDWHYEISLQSNREGMIDSTTYFLAYFYPRVAVYDDYYGWDRIPFVDSHEFYSDFNDYTVTLNVPKNYIVWGTGTLQKPETLLQPAALKRYSESFTSDDVIHVAMKEDIAAKNITTQNEMNSWQFTASNIPDMTFCISDHYVWDAASVVVDKKTNRRASTQAAYNDTAMDFHHMAGFTRHSLSWFSNNWPGISYPYEKMTVVQGYADMEYPMMVNDGTNKDTTFSKFVAEHEIAHTYMPFYMGINETRYGFMDEGWATTFELLIGRDDMGKERAENFYKRFRVNGWINDAASDEQIPIIVPGDAMSLTGGFGNNEYGKASLGYLAVMDMLGEDMFKKCLHAYMERWNGKHPMPWDFFNTFNDVSGKNLNWFWNNWFFGTGYIDLAVDNVKQTSGGYNITVKNAGGFFAPADVVITYTDGTSEKKHISSSVWEKDAQQTVVTVSTKKKIQSVKLDGGIFMDANENDNVREAEGQKGF